MNEKQKAEALRRAREIQPGEGSEVKEFQTVIKETEAREAELYAGRGYGGYINTSHIEAIRKDREEAVTEIERIRAGAH